MTPQEAVKFMKENKILSLKDGALEITLMPEALLPPPAPDKHSKEDVPPIDLDEVGLTGTTRRLQLELLGRVFDEDFKKG